MSYTIGWSFQLISWIDFVAEDIQMTAFPESINPVTSVTVHPNASCIVYRFYIDVFIVGHIPQLILVLFLFETNIPIKTS